MSDTAGAALVVDDDADTAAAMQMLLARWGCPAGVALDAQSALRLAAQDRPRLVFLDLDLGADDGVQVMRAMRGVLPRSPRPTIVCLTGHGEAEVRARCLQAGFDAFFTKPMPLEAIGALARDVAADLAPVREPRA